MRTREEMEKLARLLNLSLQALLLRGGRAPFMTIARDVANTVGILRTNDFFEAATLAEEEGLWVLLGKDWVLGTKGRARLALSPKARLS